MLYTHFDDDDIEPLFLRVKYYLPVDDDASAIIEFEPASTLFSGQEMIDF